LYFVPTERKLIVITSGDIVPTCDDNLFSALTQNLGGRKVKAHRKVEADAT
jgi:hypothetical protein